MNLDRILHMVINMVVRRGVNEGLNRGIDVLSRKGKRAEEMSDEERNRADALKGQAHGMRRLMRQTRRFGRF